MNDDEVNEFREVLRQLNARSIRSFARSLPWPYNAMVNDITGAIQSRGNYLAALGLATYTEVCGRQIIFGGRRKESYDRCFNEFIKYMGIGEVLDWEIIFEGKPKRIKDAIRNGLVHEYFLKAHEGSVAMISRSPEANRLGFLLNDSCQLAMVVIPYFAQFRAALSKAKREGKLIWQ